MASPILNIIPPEIQLRIFSFLPAHNLAQLARISKHFNDIVTPLFWTDVELHVLGYHGSQRELSVPPPVRHPISRSYLPRVQYRSIELRAERFFNMLQTLQKERPDRLEVVTKRIKHLCANVNPGWIPRTKEYKPIYDDAISVWELLPYMTNLESLELHGSTYNHPTKPDPVQELTGPTPKLRFVKLKGYMPASIPTWALRAADTLERLELLMLDRPISTNMNDRGRFLPLPHEKISHQEDGDEEDSEEDSDDNASDWGSLSGEAVIPRPLGGYLTFYGDNELKLPKLKHLYLCQPSESDYEPSFDQYSWSTRAEEACYSDWKKILIASMPTLSTLVLEQRPAADYIENDGIPEDEWMEHRTIPEASKKLLKMVRKVIEADKSQGSLQRVYLYGIFVGILDDGMPDPAEPSGKFMEFLQGCGVECEARRGQWCFFNKDDGGAMWDSFFGNEKDEDMEDGDETMKWDDVMAMV
ncbi:hypothetical protein NW752_007266 [Fusarium irregulare]|uniref:F-box domain-containing protein n=1 Tax=Fusarium irregulare TaxID=2494466 RepID=A0A9W8U9D1_9HYPO|nr:hypothetical protein NW766_007836 [Fusarium irregulare]KAJ4014501.1 hypothetical protein NW752_007266 [Fusarium irregulare]